jgi:phage terminase small subunit
MIIQELMRIGFGDIRNIVKWNGDIALIKNSDELTKDDMAMVAGVVQKKSKFGDTVEIKFNDKLAALDKLARHVGLYKDVVEVKKTVAISDEDKELLERIGIKVDD